MITNVYKYLKQTNLLNLYPTKTTERKVQNVLWKIKSEFLLNKYKQWINKLSIHQIKDII